jgi:hypothetical protein
MRSIEFLDLLLDEAGMTVQVEGDAVAVSFSNPQRPDRIRSSAAAVRSLLPRRRLAAQQRREPRPRPGHRQGRGPDARRHRAA